MGIMDLELFLEEVFEEYGLSYERLVGQYDEIEREWRKPVLEMPDGQVNMVVVRRAAKVLGLDEEDILSMDDHAAKRWYKKFKFFDLSFHLNDARLCSFHKDEQHRRVARVMRTVKLPYAPTRYDLDSVYVRLVESLKEMDPLVPGLYHKGAEITDLQITTDAFFHFEQIGEYVRSYLAMLDRVRGLFERAWDSPLSPDEIKEYNFLVSTIGIQDYYYRGSGTYLYYDLLTRFIPVYKQEGETDFFSLIYINSQNMIKPWKCAEFALDRGLVQRFVNYWPRAKAEMRAFAMECDRFLCSFVWSDAEPIIKTEEELNEVNYTAELLGQEPLTFETCARERTEIYVFKTSDELSGDKVFAEKLLRLSGAENRGGVHTNYAVRQLEPHDIHKMAARVSAYSERWEGIYHE